jgi:hypothetical protein
VPVLAYHTETGRGGPEALADLATPGPYRFELVSLPAEAMADLHDARALRVPPGMPAGRLAGDQDLAARTRERAPERRNSQPESDGGASTQPGAVEAFLDDEEKIEAIRAAARTQARERATEWGLADLGE